MPIYEFRCENCGHVFEELVRFGNDQGLKCPECGSTDTRKAVSLFGFSGVNTGSSSSSSSASSGAACAPSG